MSVVVEAPKPLPSPNENEEVGCGVAGADIPDMDAALNEKLLPADEIGGG